MQLVVAESDVNGYLTPDGFYYEAPVALSGDDMEVPVRPSISHRFDTVKREWVPHRFLSGSPATHGETNPTGPEEEGKNRPPSRETAMRAENIRLTLKDAIQITFAVVSIVSVYFALKQEIQAVQYEVAALREQNTALQNRINEHSNNETAHWRQFQEVNKSLRELENEVAFNKRINRN